MNRGKFKLALVIYHLMGVLVLLSKLTMWVATICTKKTHSATLTTPAREPPYLFLEPTMVRLRGIWAIKRSPTSTILALTIGGKGLSLETLLAWYI